jgi:DNA-directed RNA polymerase subunit RPC12/RpoP
MGRRKVSQCPTCKAEIDHLILVGNRREQFYFGSGAATFPIEGGEGELEDREYRCPKCHDTLFKDGEQSDAEGDAVNFLADE